MIELTDVTKTYTPRGQPPVEALKATTLTIPDGKVTALIGESGAGKTTVGRLIDGLVRPTSGSIRIDGVEISKLRHRELIKVTRNIGVIFQGSALLARRTVAENVQLPLRITGVGKRERQHRSLEMLARVGLESKANAYPAQLSGGQRQRVGIARALAPNPDYLLADEATSGLDAKTTRAILKLIRELSDDLNLTTILITHEMDVVREIADRAVLFEEGRVVEESDVGAAVRSFDSRLGRLILPGVKLPHAPEGYAVWEVNYEAGRVSLDWFAALSFDLDSRLVLLGGVSEVIHGDVASRLFIGVPHELDATKVVESGERLGLILTERKVSST